jgi:dCTP deaminase
MILSDQTILEEIENGNILIEPFNRDCLGSNSYDVHLSKHLAMYKNQVLDVRQHNEIDEFTIPDEGYVVLRGDQ